MCALRLPPGSHVPGTVLGVYQCRLGGLSLAHKALRAQRLEAAWYGISGFDANGKIP